MLAFDIGQSLGPFTVVPGRDASLQIAQRYVQDRSGRENHRALDHVFQLADVPGPLILGQGVHRFRGDRVNRLVHSSRRLSHKMMHEQRNILGSFPQGRNGNGEDIQAVIEVAAKLLLQDHFFQVAMRRGDNANVHFLRPRAAQPLEFPLLQNAQQFRLQLERDIADFVQKQRTLVCQLERGRFFE